MKKITTIVAVFLFAVLMTPSVTTAESDVTFVPEVADSRMTYHFNNNLSLDRYTRRLQQTASTLRRSFSLSQQKRNSAVAEALAAKNSSKERANSRSTVTRTDNHTNFLHGSSEMPVRHYHLNRCNSRFYSRNFSEVTSLSGVCR